MTLADLYDQHAKECKRELADVNGDGRHDIVGFASSGIYVSQAHDFLVISPFRGACPKLAHTCTISASIAARN